MPYEKNVADVDGESLRCWVCDGILRPETTIDLHSGVSIELQSCSSVPNVDVDGMAVSGQDR